jgi:hypothetical protein
LIFESYDFTSAKGLMRPSDSGFAINAVPSVKEIDISMPSISWNRLKLLGFG